MIRMVWSEIMTQIHLQQARPEEDDESTTIPTTLIPLIPLIHWVPSKLSRVTSEPSAATMTSFSLTVLSTAACEALFKSAPPLVSFVDPPQSPRSNPGHCPLLQVDQQTSPWTSSSLYFYRSTLGAAECVSRQYGQQGCHQP